ncbi:MAG TPA: circadian clock KaiB family protein [Oligoflexus sp.]|uniref:circadian clock KaiB family protein n=1 Tax=Oligoflexus sp. TaxID=1971216 RepID=UPI002D57D531|nr:circadian clock KaiB family protein [Oligoflexus sp.]HYX39555.1 circadian clock KaiB family protein [Oligoflexus sp.]
MQYVLRLFVAGPSEHSTAAIRNLWAMSRGPLKSNAKFDIVDVRLNPETAEAHNVFITPTLLNLAPGSVRRVVGDLSDHDHVLAALGITQRSGKSDAEEKIL